jgi:hypothetical protein
MSEIVKWLFSENNSDLTIGLFDIWHFLYLFIIFGGCFLIVFFYRNKSCETKRKITNLFCYLTIGLYVADFFIMPLSDSYSGISVYKLPFNICTLMAVLAPFVEFNKKFEKVKHAVITLSLTAALAWMCYPGSALGGQPPFSYIIFQTFMYHGFLFAWGFLNLALGIVKLDIKKIWREACGIFIILIWAAFGNAVYDGEQNWFFIEKSIFPFLSDEIMPPVVVIVVFAGCLLIYGVYYLVCWIKSKRTTADGEECA